MKLFGVRYQHRQLYYVVGDVLIAMLSILLGHALGQAGLGHGGPDVLGILDRHTGASLFFISSTLLVLYVADAYNASLDFRQRYEIVRLWAAVILAFLVQLLVYAIFPHGWWGRGVAGLTSLSMGVLLTIWRASLCWISPRPLFRRKTLVVGAGRGAHLLTSVILGQDEHDRMYNLVGFLRQPSGHTRRHSDHPLDERPDLPGPPILGGVADLLPLVDKHGIELIIVAIRGGLSSELTQRLLECKARGVQIEDMPTIYKRLTGKVPILHLSGDWLIFGPVFAGTSRRASAVERIVDVALSLFGLVLSAPVIAVAALAVRLESKGPAFYLQERLGRNERPFRIIKLRTMYEDAERGGPRWAEGRADDRQTRVGRILRPTRIDELPQFLNVLRGDMSLVGPRPEREHFVTDLKKQIPFYSLRFSVKPGVTGWAQVNYRYGANVEDAVEKLCYELYAVQEMSPVLYVLILLKTVQTVLLRPGS